MSNRIILPAVVFCSLLFLAACSKNVSDSQPPKPASLGPDRVITAKVAPGQTQVLTIADAGELSIVRQASHYSVSQTSVDPKNNALLYSYSPAAGFTGTDEVLLSHEKPTGYSGNCNYGDGAGMSSMLTTYVTIKITVAN